MSTLIGICGKKRHGKDTVGDYLVKEYGFIKISFSDKLKEICKILFNFSDEQLYGSLKETEDPYWKVTPRNVLQFVGTDLFRNQLSKIIPHIKKDFWVECVKHFLLQNKHKRIVICDVRFINEANMIKDLGGKLIKITRNLISQDDHASEQEVDLIKTDYNIKNNETITELYREIDKLFVCPCGQINYIV
jgi:dephospho-CoA kinase